MKILVTGGTGTVGSQVVAELLKRGVSVRCMTHSKEKVKSLPSGVQGVVGDLEQPGTLSSAFKGVDGVFLLNALSQTETQQGLAGVEAAKTAGVKRLVYLSVPMPEGSKHIPHFKSKIPIEEAIKKSEIAYTILRPNNFFQNDFWLKDAILSYNLYPQPIGSVGLHRVDVRDIAQTAANAFLENGHETQEYTVHGPDALTGEKVAETYSRHLGKKIRYAGDDLATWAQAARQMMPEWMVHDLRIMYQYFQERGFQGSAADFAKQKKVLGHEPRRFDAFVAELVQSWKR